MMSYCSHFLYILYFYLDEFLRDNIILARLIPRLLETSVYELVLDRIKDKKK